MEYVDLAQFGLHLVPFEDARFPPLMNAILGQPRPFPIPAPDMSEVGSGGVLLNESGKTIVALAVTWRYASPEGRPSTSYISNLGSSAQIDLLAGIAADGRDNHSYILPRSKRLLTERMIFGDNRMFFRRMSGQRAEVDLA